MVSTRFEVNSNPPMRYPRSIFFIISNEFSERFNYYGMRTVLALYLTQQLAYSNDTATVIYHVFTSLVYFFPLMGAILADSWLGKFKTILYLSIVYCAGSALIALGAIPPLHLPATSITVLGLLFIAVGSGGIKPCVSAFGGDQFKLPEQAVQLAKFFSLFYFAINAGSLISTTLTPILREDVHCFGQDNCFALAFGVPAALMIFSIIVFVCGRAMYTINKPSGNMIVLVFKCIRNALTVRSKERSVNPRDHWLDYAEPKYGKGTVADIKSLMKILILYIPLPVFWALFDQQGSRWTFQATRMDGEFAGYTIKPDQIQVINPLLILAFIPLFESFVYPALAKIGIRRPLQKLSFGGILAGAAFLLSGFVEIALDRTNAMLPAPHESQMRIFNGLPCDFRFHTDAMNLTSFSVPSRGVFEALHLEPLANYTEFKYRAETGEIGCVRENASEVSGSFRLRQGQAVGYYLTSKGGKIEVLEFEDTAEKDRNGVPRVRLLANIKTAKYAMLRHVSNSEISYNMSLNRHDQMTIANGEYQVYVGDRLISTVKLNVGGVYTLLLDEVLENEFNLQKHTITPSNSVHMLWLVPQYVVITAGEVMFSITGLEFSYSQAPESMKSVIQAFWLLTVAIGNMLVVFIAEAKFVQSQSLEFFLFAVLMFLDMGLFMVLAVRYHYSQDGAIESIEVEATGKKDPLPGATGSDALSDKGSTRATGGGTTYANEAFRED